jgi:hypothetical protein
MSISILASPKAQFRREAATSSAALETGRLFRESAAASELGHEAGGAFLELVKHPGKG